MNELLCLLPEAGFLRFAWDAVWQTGSVAALTWLCVRLLASRPVICSWLIVLGVLLCLMLPALSWSARSRGYGLLAESVSRPSTSGAGHGTAVAATGDGLQREPALRLSEPARLEPQPAALDQADHAAGRFESLGASSAASLEPLASRSPRDSTLSRPAYLELGLAGIWALATLLLSLRLFNSWLAIRSLSRHAKPCRDPAILAACRRAAKSLGLPIAPRVYLSEWISCPTVAAWGQASLFIPAECRHTSDWYHVCCHELAHVRRRDAWARLLIEISTAVLPWQPLMWILRREHHAACERACDDWVLFLGADPVEYASTLTTWICRERALLALRVGSRRLSMQQRVERVLDATSASQPRLALPWLASSCLTALLLIVIVPLLQPGHLGIAFSQQEANSAEPALVDDRVPPQRVDLRGGPRDSLETEAKETTATVVTKLGDGRLKHSALARAVGFDASGEIVISACETLGTDGENTIRLWKAATGESVDVIEHANRGVALSPDGRTLLVGKTDGAVQLIDTSTRRVLREFPGPAEWRSVFTISRDGSTLASFSASGADDDDVTLWDIPSGTLVNRLTVPRIRLRAGLALSPNGNRLATASSDPPAVTIWDTRSGELIQRLVDGHQSRGPVSAVAFSPNGQTLAVAGPKNKLRLWSIDTMEPGGVLTTPSIVYAISFSPDSRFLAAADFRAITFWDVPANNKIWQADQARSAMHSDKSSIAFSSDGRRLAVGSHNRIKILTTSTGELAEPEGAAVEEFTSMALSPGEDRLAIGTSDGMIEIWNLALNRRQQRWQGHSAAVRRLAFSPDSRTLASAAQDRTVILWDPSTERIRHRLDQRLSVAPYHIGFSPDGKTLVSSFESSRTNLWNAASGELVQQLQGKRGGLRGPVAFTPDGKTLFAVDSIYNVTLWDPATAILKATLSERTHSVTHLALSRDATCVAAAAGYPGRIHVWDVARHQKIMDQTVPRLHCLTFHPDGHLLASVGRGSLQIWNPQTCELTRRLQLDRRSGPIRQMIVSNDGTQLFALRANGTACVLAL